MEIKHNFNIMNPQGNRQNQHQNVNARLPDARFLSNFIYPSPASMGDARNFMMPMPHQYFYGGYPYAAMPCPNAAYFAPIGSQWRDINVIHPSFMKEISSLPNFYNSQTTRVTTRETKDKSQLEVINLQSDEEQKKIKNGVLVPTNNNINKQSQRPIQVIELDENSGDKNLKQAGIPIVNQATTNIQPLNKTQKIEKAQLKIQKTQVSQPKKKDHSIQFKTKHILKLKKKQHKISNKTIKQQKTSKQRKKKYIQHQKKKIKQDKQISRALQKVQKKKLQRNEKIQKVQIPQVKKKIEECHTKQIAKYMESHGQIRHGKQFQSDIPSIKITDGTQFNCWLQEKRKRLLKRQVGPLTY